MILQQAPRQASIWGFCKPGARVELTIGDDIFAAKLLWWNNLSTWQVLLPEVDGTSITEQFKKYNITATDGNSTVQLSDVLFGDVWVCSGQSNMQYSLGSPTCWNASNIDCKVRDAQCSYGCVENAGEELKAMAGFPNMRLMVNEGPQSSVPLDESNESPWMVPGADVNFDGRFSAACWFFGRDLYKSLSPPRPIGLMETNVGGTPDMHWSSPDALAACSPPALTKPWAFPAGFKDSVLWNGKVVPLTRTTITGAIWYQGEANSGKDGRQYQCSFRAMIDDWRSKWAFGTGGATDPDFPFGWAQLNSNGVATPLAANFTSRLEPGQEDNLGQWGAGFPGLRAAQDFTLAAPNTFQAVILDTPVASGSIHSPYKQACGARLARGALSVAYRQPHETPRFAEAHASGKTVTVSLSGVSLGLDIRAKFGFEVLGNDTTWHAAPIVSSFDGSVFLDTSRAPGGKPTALRYLYYTTPCGMTTYNCPIYAKAKALGQLSGEFDFLPLGPFITCL
eukprot:g1432.t1